MDGPPRRIGLVEFPHRPESGALASAALEVLRQAGTEVWTADSWEAPVVAQRLDSSDLVICFGGDGTLIRGARLAAPLGVPIVGVNFGKMGFLTEFAPDELLAGLPRLLAGDFWLEERITLAVEHRRDGQLMGSYLAINEAVVGRGRVNKMVRLYTWVDGQYMTTYAADGLLCATPTGSSGSNFAAGGPVLPPDMDALVLVPVMPFVSFRNALVLAGSSRVDVQVSLTPAPPLHEAFLSVDGGAAVMVKDGDRLTFAAGSVRCRFARLRPKHYFHAMLVSKLQRPPIEPPLPADTPSPARAPGAAPGPRSEDGGFRPGAPHP
ncbi:MAG TPA: NAD(+)/NADH kinase [Chloroflexota bacterium]|nr:NAD(+)/NADH kinase [Chloroflexota bacterium]